MSVSIENAAPVDPYGPNRRSKPAFAPIFREFRQRRLLGLVFRVDPLPQVALAGRPPAFILALEFSLRRS